MPPGAADFDSHTALLGGLSKRKFMRRHWQRLPLLVSRAFDSSVAKLADRQLLSALAARAGVESRLVERRRNGWRVRYGPLTRSCYPAAGTHPWTLLVSGFNLHAGAAQTLLERFSFLSWPRTDDVMASYAVPGGGVGPHVDSYDVFLIQGAGRRRWRISSPREYALVPGVPLKLIANFHSEHEYVLEAGDMLYLPPGWGHEGTALEPCVTFSVGFRAPQASELAASFLDWLQERGLPEDTYRDLNAAPSSRPGRIPRLMLDFTQARLAQLRWTSADVERFLGEYLSAPKPSIVFQAPARKISKAVFDRRLARALVRLSAKSLLLYRAQACYLNGERVVVPRTARQALRRLADAREQRGAELLRCGAARLMHEWYGLGYIQLRS